MVTIGSESNGGYRPGGRRGTTVPGGGGGFLVAGGGTVLEPRAVWVFAGHAFVFGVRRVDERARTHRQGRDLIRLERAHQARRDQHHQLGALGAIGPALEKVADDRDPAQKGNRRGSSA